jgi:hypothetical protein
VCISKSPPLFCSTRYDSPTPNYPTICTGHWLVGVCHNPSPSTHHCPVCGCDLVNALIDYVLTDGDDSDPNLPLGLPLNYFLTRLYFSILINEDHGILVRRALAHRLFRFDRNNIWWSFQTTLRCPLAYQRVMQDIHNRWKHDGFSLHTDMLSNQCECE